MRVVSLLGVTQILSWGTSYYLPAVLSHPIARDTGWNSAIVVGGLSWALVVAAPLAPVVGRTIDRHGGRRVLALSSFLLAAGIALLGTASSIPVLYAAWTVIGLGMACGLYDPAFATLTRLYGASARPAITGLTLLGGLASTIGWPAVAALEHKFGWRIACFIIAGAHITVGSTIHLLLLPRPPEREPRPVEVSAAASEATKPDRRFLYLVVAFTLFSCVSAGLSVNYLEVLRRLGIDPGTAVVIGMIIGPSQVAARIVEFTLGRGLHPLWTARGGMLLCMTGIALLAPSGPVLIVVATVIYGAGNGIMTIARGTLPLALFGSAGYGARLGRMARPGVVAQALAPFALASALDNWGPLAVLGGGLVLILLGLAALAQLRPT
ncbi:MAG TPA: MFS transporter [Candidatus Cybelea sp.]|nr:MFS transporter [Candidatus Cybelea sp.]